jgi:hypothetical protein
MPDYQKGKIYKLWSPQGDEIYIGSTINPLAKRLNHHKSTLTCRSKYLFENYDDVRIELIEEYPCNNKMQLNRKEGEHIRENECLNGRIAGRTKKEYGKEYRENNKEDIKEYRETNKEHNKEYIKEYRETNKEKINEKRSEKFDCDCGGKYTQNHKARHLKSKKHIDFTQQQEEQQPPELSHDLD